MFSFKKHISIAWVYAIAVLFILVNAYFVAHKNYYFNLVPFALLVVLFAIFNLKTLVFIVLFFVPLSIPLKELASGLDFDMFLPTEPLMFGILVMFIFKLLVERKFDLKVAKHPISIAIYINLAWILITSLTSTMPGISFKYLLVRLWFLVSFYFIATQIFKDFKTIGKYIWIYIIPLVIVIGYTINNHLSYGLYDDQAAHFVMSPFFNDHTSYGAILAMLLPIAVGFGVYPGYSFNKKVFVWIIFAILFVATLLSYSRASWIGIAAAIVIWILILLKIKFRTILIVTSVSTIIIALSWTSIIMTLEQNRQDSSADNIVKHLQSITNISSDASNLERLNRWSCAIRMFEQKPFFGWGPGTYQFNYAPFQYSYEKTIISTNAGDGGNAHSEYIGPLSESGVFGALTFAGIVVMIMYTGIRVFRKATDKRVKVLSMSILLGLVTYFVHGFLNNFLDTDKASALFWGFAAMIVAMDVYHKNEVVDFKQKEKELPINETQDQ